MCQAECSFRHARSALSGELALTAICTAVVAWLTANVSSGVIVMVLYRANPRAASQLVVRTMVESFYRIEDVTGRIALLAVVAGLLSVAIGLPNRQGEERANAGAQRESTWERRTVGRQCRGGVRRV